jgi:hypothetical protein
MVKNVQYIIIDSEFVDGTNNNFTVTFGINSNTFVEQMRDVIGVKLVNFYVTQIGSNDDGIYNEAKYLDIYCAEIPTTAQMLSERSGQVFARIGLERNFKGGTGLIMHDKDWRPAFPRETKYFNPMTIQKLSFQIWEHQGDRDYVPLQPDAEFYMILEVTTKEIKTKSEDPNASMIAAIDKLGKKFDKLSKSIQLVTNPPEPPKKKIPLLHVIIGIIILGGVAYMIKKKFSTSAVPVPGAVTGAGAGAVPGGPALALRAPGASRLL